MLNCYSYLNHADVNVVYIVDVQSSTKPVYYLRIGQVQENWGYLLYVFLK